MRDCPIPWLATGYDEKPEDTASSLFHLPKKAYLIWQVAVAGLPQIIFMQFLKNLSQAEPRKPRNRTRSSLKWFRTL